MDQIEKVILLLQIEDLCGKLAPLIKSDFKAIQKQVREITTDYIRQIPYFKANTPKKAPQKDMPKKLNLSEISLTPTALSKIDTKTPLKTPEKERPRKLNLSETTPVKANLSLNDFKTPTKNESKNSSQFNTPSTCSSQKKDRNNSSIKPGKVKRKLNFTPQKPLFASQGSGIGTKFTSSLDGVPPSHNSWEFKCQPANIQPEKLFSAALPPRVDLSRIFFGEAWKLDGYRSSEEGFR
ncbi:unnamed protein product [Blepharisma stoltei]|uniref:Uncharacterized protein n=1 Tax=Blepharisma stoltei TaxID=1481888 RepID=A0AAU9K542_9CILI|nr:unnamed protein product [Blepharisma stoltei]